MLSKQSEGEKYRILKKTVYQQCCLPARTGMAVGHLMGGVCLPALEHTKIICNDALVFCVVLKNKHLITEYYQHYYQFSWM